MKKFVIIKKFILIFEDGTFTETNGANIEEIRGLYTDSLVRTESGEVKLCIRVEDKEVFELKHRLAMIKDDLTQLIDFIDEERMMERFEKPTKVSASAWNIINNIDIASDLSKDDSLSWKAFTSIK